MTTLVTFETAKLLKEKGFDKNTDYLYDNYKRLDLGGFRDSNSWRQQKSNWNLSEKEQYSAPTIAEVVMWLYEKHGIWIHSTPENDEEDIVKWVYTIQKVDNEVRFVKRFSNHNSPTEAYQEAIKYTLNKLI